MYYIIVLYYGVLNNYSMRVLYCTCPMRVGSYEQKKDSKTLSPEFKKIEERYQHA